MKETKRETRTAKATVIPNWKKNRPDDSFHVGHGNEHGDDRQGGGQHGQSDLARSFPRGREVILPPLEMAHDVFPHHDGVIDEQADGQGQGHQGHHVQGHAQEIHDRKGGDDRNGQGQTGDDRGAPGIEEAEDDEDGQNPAENQGLFHIPHRVPDHDGGIPDHLDGGSREEAPSAGLRSPSSPGPPRPPYSPRIV